MTTLKVWTNFKDVLMNLNDAEIGRLFMMMLEYADSGYEPDMFEGNEAFIWPVAKRDIDMVTGREDANRENGKKGGRPPKTEKNRQETPVNNENPTETGFCEETEDEGGLTEETIKEKKRKEIKGKEIERESKEKPLKRFSPPSVEDVEAYCDERGNRVDAQTFVDFYSSKGWKVGNSPMKDWKACVRTWEQRDNSPRDAPAKPTKTVVAQQYEQRAYTGIDDQLMSEQDREMEEWLRSGGMNE